MHIASKFVRRLPLLALLSLIGLMAFSFCARAVETVEPATNSPSANESLRSYLQVQEQLHATQLALDRNRQETEALAAKTTAALEAKLKALETEMSKQKSSELLAMQEAVTANNRLMLKVGGAIAGVGFFILLATGYLQWRSVNRLAEVSAQIQSSRQALPLATGGAALLGEGQMVQSQDRLFGALSQLEKRILQLENTTHPAIEASLLAPGTTTATNGQGLNGHGGESTNGAPNAGLVAKGQSYLDQDKPTEALACFEEILKIEPDHSEALVKKGLALEALQRSEEALACYDKAIAANADLTIAFLQKGGLLNRMERYEEALQCYELALRAQEKAHAA